MMLTPTTYSVGIPTTISSLTLSDKMSNFNQEKAAAKIVKSDMI